MGTEQGPYALIASHQPIDFQAASGVFGGRPRGRPLGNGLARRLASV